MAATPISPHSVDPDFGADDFYLDPYRHYAGYRRDTPVFRNRDGVVYLTRYRDCEFALTDRRFRRQPPGGGVNPFTPGQREPSAIDVMVSHWMIFMDPPRHDLVRQAFSAPFGAGAVRRLEPAVRAVAEHLLSGWRGRDAMEVVAGFASPFPIFVLCEMLGIARADWPRFDAWSSQIMRAMDSGAEDEMRTAIPVSLEIRDYFSAVLGAHERHPRGDTLGDLIDTGRQHGLTDDELVFGIAFLLLAGHETTKNLLASGVLTLARHPEQTQLLRTQPALLESAVEEVLRFESPFQKFSRWTSARVVFGEYAVDEGTLVTVLAGAANRDPDVFPEPQRFDVRRSPNRHLAFSRGVHVCLGTALARLEARIAFAALLEKLPEIRVVEYRWRPKSAFRALDSLTLSLEGS